MSKKCLDCKLCLDVIWIEPKRFYHCFLCDQFYDIIGGVLTKIDVDTELQKYYDLIAAQEERKINERPS